MAIYNFTVVIEPDEEAYHAYVPALSGCHSFGATIDEARANITEAIELHVESLQEDGRFPLALCVLSCVTQTSASKTSVDFYRNHVE